MNQTTMLQQATNQGTDAEFTVAQKQHRGCPAIGVIFAGAFFAFLFLRNAPSRVCALIRGASKKEHKI